MCVCSISPRTKCTLCPFTSSSHEHFKKSILLDLSIPKQFGNYDLDVGIVSGQTFENPQLYRVYPGSMSGSKNHRSDDGSHTTSPQDEGKGRACAPSTSTRIRGRCWQTWADGSGWGFCLAGWDVFHQEKGTYPLVNKQNYGNSPFY